MRQFLLPQDYTGTGRLALSGRDHHYLSRVLRLGEGAHVPGRLADGTLLTMEIVSVGDGRVVLEPRGAVTTGSESWDITLLQCIPKGRKLEQIVRQAVEAGVSRIVPIVSRHSVVRLEAESLSGGRIERLQRVAREAMQQCGARKPIVIAPPAALADVGPSRQEASVFFHERPVRLEPGGQSGYDPAGASLHGALAGAPRSVRLLVGPEGGLAEAEVTHLIGAGFRPVYLGATVLRVETAAIFALGAVKTLLLEHDTWRLK